MGESSSTINLDKAIIAAQAEMQAVPMDSKNDFFHSKFASLGAGSTRRATARWQMP